MNNYSKTELDKLIHKAAKNLSEQKDYTIYEAALEEAEAVVFTRNENDLERLDNEAINIYNSRYKICDTIREAKSLLSILERENTAAEYVEIPVYAVRIARESKNFKDFRRKMVESHPQGDKQ